ncbi:MAG: galactose-1-epimerase [Alphaproteobacteria bacterium]|nr:MAG: galactose-1-epimerase [Alphaproteobacteria bacterium]
MTGPVLGRRVFAGGLAAVPLSACTTLRPSRQSFGTAGVTESRFGTTASSEPVWLFTLTNRAGHSAKIMTWGAAVTSLMMPDRAGVSADVVLGLDTYEDYVARSRNFGTTVGRYAGRIADGRFDLDGRTVQLDTSGGAHSSHGGPIGFAKRNWTGRVDETAAGPGVAMTLASADGDQGFPGELIITVIYRLTHDDRLTLSFEATTTRPTVLNPTHHSYFNLSGDPERLVLDHVVTINADRFTAFGPDKIVTGELRPVAGTPLDFRLPKPVGRDLAVPDEQMTIGGGYDHNFVVRGPQGTLRRAARVDHPASGRRLELWTTEPGVQFYTANPVEMIGRGGVAYHPRCGLCLEPQHYQNSPNRPEFPSTVLRPGETFRSASEYRFSLAGSV